MIKEFSNPYKLPISPETETDKTILARIKARATKGRTLTGDEPSAAPDQTAGKQRAERAKAKAKEERKRRKYAR